MTAAEARAPGFGPGREFERILSILGDLPAADDTVEVGPGDDAVVLKGGIVVSTDLAMEGIHFLLDWISTSEAGFRSAAGGLSDLAAMAAEPLGILASVGAPGDGSQAEQVMEGVKALAAQVGAPLLGGDLTRSPGPIVIDIVSVGRSKRPLLRSGASPGEELWVTGQLGGAAGAAALWSSGRAVPAPLRTAFVAPLPRLREARWLAEAGATSGIDLSDGLGGDAAHLAAMSGVGIVIEPAAIPLHPSLDGLDLGPPVSGVDFALHGGDDFELAVTLPPGLEERGAAEFTERFGLSLTRVGRVVPGRGVGLQEAGSEGPVPLARGGFDHFGAAGSP